MAIRRGMGICSRATDGNFYGTTYYGGANNGGTVFKMTPAGALTTLYSFAPYAPENLFGAWIPGPEASLVQASDGNLYGVSKQNGSANNGTIFKISTNGAFSSLYQFVQVNNTGYVNGSMPNGGMVVGADGNLWGTTYWGGSGGTNPFGTVFKVTLGGALTRVQSFDLFSLNGCTPAAGLLLASDGNFYGTLDYEIFKMTPGGLMTYLHTFSTLGGTPTTAAPLIQGSDGDLYGTTTFGDSNWGTVFKITTGGTYTLLHSFPYMGVTDGDVPDHAPLVQAPDGNFYGTTSLGGANNLGTIYKITPGGTFTLLYSFAASDGQWPLGGMVLGKDGNLYGTTSAGGSGFKGTVFKFTLPGGGTTPPPPPGNGPAPAVTGIVNGASFKPGAPVASGGWVTVFGTNLAPAGDSRPWNPSTEIVGGKLPTSLDGTSVTVNGKLAAVAYISPGQVNIQPPDDSAVGPVQVAVTTAAGGAGAPFTATYAQFAPGLFPASGNYIAAQHSNGTYVGGYAGATPAAPGEVIVLWGSGFGPASPAVPAGQVFAGANKLANPTTVTIGGQPAVVDFAGVVGAGLVQINVHVPMSINPGDAAVVAMVGGASTQTTGNFISVGSAAPAGASVVVPSVAPNPVYQGVTDANGYSWFYTVKLTETAGTATTLTGFTYTVPGYAALDLSSSIVTLFGSAAIPAKGTLSAPLRTQLTAPGNVTFGFTGMDANGAKWTQQISVPFLGMQ